VQSGGDLLGAGVDGAICWGPVWMAARLVRPSTATADVGRAARRRLRVSPS